MGALDELKKQMETPEFAESARKYMEEYFGRIEEKKKKVSSEEYIGWLYDYVSVNKHMDDEAAGYTYNGIDAEYGQIIGAFLDYVEELAVQQRVLVVSDEDCGFENEKIVVKIMDKYFEIFRMYGQGSWTSVELLEEEPDYAYVKISK